ncbi:hypothetical protein Tcan_04147 [Toxocara canis]|uniref:Uncharacterized protein n=1 Tax=Toxocara canis TaxID=6265 RepID=A0A0B2VV35_TOXCA|nr:hypothetical protein Tcan_04147 [Toxocara canis]
MPDVRTVVLVHHHHVDHHHNMMNHEEVEAIVGELTISAKMSRSRSHLQFAVVHNGRTANGCISLFDDLNVFLDNTPFSSGSSRQMVGYAKAVEVAKYCVGVTCHLAKRLGRERNAWKFSLLITYPAAGSATRVSVELIGVIVLKEKEEWSAFVSTFVVDA